MRKVNPNTAVNVDSKVNYCYCFSLRAGALLWQGSLRFGSPMIAGDKLVYLDERGELFYLELDKTEEKIISSHELVPDGKSWQMPVIANGYVYCRNSMGKLVCAKVN